MGKFIGILLLIIAGIAVGFIINLIIDFIVILFKKLSKKIRMAMGIPYKEEAPMPEETPEQEQAPKQNNNDLLQKILAKRKNAASDVEHPAEQEQKNADVEVTEYEVKK